MLEGTVAKAEIKNIDHIYKGAPGSRQISSMSVVEFGSKFARDACLEKLSKSDSILKSKEHGDVTVQRAKTTSQLKRNTALVTACEALKKDPRCKNKKIEICWLKENAQDKDRSVDVDGVSVFLQKRSNLSGSFDGQFQDICI